MQRMESANVAAMTLRSLGLMAVRTLKFIISSDWRMVEQTEFRTRLHFVRIVTANCISALIGQICCLQSMGEFSGWLRSSG